MGSENIRHVVLGAPKQVALVMAPILSDNRDSLTGARSKCAEAWPGRCGTRGLPRSAQLPPFEHLRPRPTHARTLRSTSACDRTAGAQRLATHRAGPSAPDYLFPRYAPRGRTMAPEGRPSDMSASAAGRRTHTHARTRTPCQRTLTSSAVATPYQLGLLRELSCGHTSQALSLFPGGHDLEPDGCYRHVCLSTRSMW